MKKVLIGVLLTLLTAFSSVNADVSPETVVDIFQRLESLEKKTRELHGKNEELQHQISQLKKQQKEGFLAIDDRIDKLKKTTTDNVDTKTESSKDTEEPKVKIIDKKPETSSNDQKPKEEVAKTSTPTDADVKKESKVVETAKKEETKKKIRAATTYEKETYQAAFNLMKTSPSAATKAFKEYIKLQPKSPLAANAQYWIGEIMYSHNNYKGAVQEFIKVLQKYKYSSKAPDAAIKLGYSFYALKNWDYARRTFEDVLKYFPENKNAVSLATKRLEKMKAAGN